MSANKTMAIFIKIYVVLVGIVMINVAYAAKEWTGAYLGINAGGFWGHSNVATSAVNDALINQPDTPDILFLFNQNSAGTILSSNFTAGVEGGYNLQFDTTVFGLELDFNSFPINNSRIIISTYVPEGELAYHQQQTVQTDWLFTLRPRVGYTQKNTLLYVTGGLAVTQLKGNYTLFDGSTIISGDNVKNQNGWTLGGGIEHLLKGRWGNYWSIKAEYLYANFGNIPVMALDQAAAIGQTTGIGDIVTTSVGLSTNIVRAGINYHF